MSVATKETRSYPTGFLYKKQAICGIWGDIYILYDYDTDVNEI
jgi:hypothetical protein